MEIHTNFSNTVNVIHRLTLDDLADPAKLELLPILKPLETIECRDALLTELLSPASGRGVGGEGARLDGSNHPGASRHPSLSKEGNLEGEAAWPVADAIVGNPPFLGDYGQSAVSRRQEAVGGIGR